MTRDELADYFKVGFDELEAEVAALGEGSVKRRAVRLASIMHRAAEELKELAVDEELIQPFSGGEEKPPEGP